MKAINFFAIFSLFALSYTVQAISPQGARLACLCDDDSLVLSKDAANLDANYGNWRWCSTQCGSRGFTRGDKAKGDYYGFLNLEEIVAAMSPIQLKEQIAKNGVNESSVGSAGRLREVLQKQFTTEKTTFSK